MTRRFYHPSLPAPGERATLLPTVSHHLLRVCRLPRGATLTLFDARGAAALAALVDVQGDRAVVEMNAAVAETDLGQLGAGPVLLQALCKHAAFDMVIRMATELGAAEIRPVLTQRSVAAGERSERWLRIATSAAAQCGRNGLPRIAAPLPLVQALQAPDLPVWRLVLLPRAPVATNPSGSHPALLVGPEGGLTEAEVSAALQAGFEPAGLPGNTLRADTAAAAALARYALAT